MSQKKIIIIGAGISGLAAGCYLRMNGYDTQIFEMWKIPGGVCTAWKRKGYTFEGCIHWLLGLNPKNNFYKFWEEMQAVQNMQAVFYDEHVRIEYTDGKYFVMYSDINKLKAEFLRIAPEDEKVITEFINVAKKFSKAKFPIEKAMEVYTIFDGLKLLITKFPVIKLFGKWNKISIKEFTDRLKSADLKGIFAKILPNEFSMNTLFMLSSVLHTKSAGYPIGGALEFANSIEKRYLGLGGKINYDSKVAKILTDNNRAVGIKLANGDEYKADVIISAADGHYTIFEMLDGKYLNQEILDNYNNLPLFPAILQISLGIAKDLREMPHLIIFRLDKTITVSDKGPTTDLGVRICNFDPTLAPAGKTAVTVVIETEFEYWERFKNNPPEYESEKKRIADEVIDALDRHFGDIKTKVEVVDVATPLTYVRYTNNWRGSWEGWYPTVKTMSRRISKTLPGLQDFYMVGQWVEPGGGLPIVAMSGRNVAQIICKKDRKKFVTSVV